MDRSLAPAMTKKRSKQFFYLVLKSQTALTDQTKILRARIEHQNESAKMFKSKSFKKIKVRLFEVRATMSLQQRPANFFFFFGVVSF